MKNSSINYKKFIQYVQLQFEDDISLEELELLLQLKESYNKDSPESLGKSLILNRLFFSGQKISGEEFTFDQKLYTGINAWIADNHKGKSTIFKIIKFALTGTDSIKKDIKSWIDEILLEFSIGKVIYTCYIDRKGRDRGAMYRFTISDFIEFRNNQKLDAIDKETEFEFRSNTQLEEKLQEFFFEQFSFYTLKYTQKSSSKENFELNTANLSWATYFKSIYLESSNYEYLFFDNEKIGAQGRKIFEMILGLPLTYPINRLTVQRDRVLEDIGKIKLTHKTKTETTKEKKIKLLNRYEFISKELGNLKESSKITFNEKPLIEEYNNIQEKINLIRRQQRLLNETYQTEKDKQYLINKELVNLEIDKHKIEGEINKHEKQKLNIELYKQAGSFFSSLDIKICPHCETDVSDSKKTIERENHICSLCGELSTQQKVEKAELQAKIDRITEVKESHIKKLTQIEKTIAQHFETLKRLDILIAEHFSQVVSITPLDEDNKRLKEIEIEIESINKEREKQKGLIDNKDELIKEEAILKFQLEEIEKEKLDENAQAIKNLYLKRDILDYALDALEKKRIKINKDIINKLEEHILNEVHSFGLKNINKIEISNKYELIFTQNNVVENFNDLTEGEKLRVKLAFYLSLIQLDIENKLGRHPRFLIFDSPGSEEMVPKHLQGLSDILKDVNDRFKDQLQIFVGTALREFSDITEKKKILIKKEDEFIF